MENRIYSGRLTVRITAPSEKEATQLFHTFVTDEDIAGVELVEYDVQDEGPEDEGF